MFPMHETLYNSPDFTDFDGIQEDMALLPKIIERAGHDVSACFIRFQTDEAEKSRHAQYTHGLTDFLYWLEDRSDTHLSDVVSDNVSEHLSELEAEGCEIGDLMARLCAIDNFWTLLSKIQGEGYQTFTQTLLPYSIPPRLIVESSTDESDFVAHYAEFLIRHTNPRTRESYRIGLNRFFSYFENSNKRRSPIHSVLDIKGRDISAFIAHCEVADDHGLVDDKARTVSATMSAVRMLFDLYIAEGLMTTNVARAVKLPKIASGKGTTPVLTDDLVSRIIDMIPLETPADYRDRALIATMAYSLFRISAVTKLRVRDYQMRGNLRWIVATEKRSKTHEMPVHEVLQYYMDEYLMVSGLINETEAPLFQGAVPNGSRLTGHAYSRNASWKMIQRRAKAVGHYGEIGNHSLRATGITNFLANGGQLEEARKMAAHKSAETTRIYDRNIDAVDPEEVSKIQY